MLNLSLKDDIKIPDITGYTPPFGTKIIRTETNKGGLSTREVNNNILSPFLKTRVFVVRNNENTTEVDFDAKISIESNSSIEFTLQNATYIGCKIFIENNSDFPCVLLCSSVKAEGQNILHPHTNTELFWNGTAWQNESAPAIGKRIVQYPQEKSPNLLYPCSQWELITNSSQQTGYEGAFFRTAAPGISEPFINNESSLIPQSYATKKNGLKILFSPGQLSQEKDPEWNIYWSGASHKHGMTFLTGYNEINPLYLDSGPYLTREWSGTFYPRIVTTDPLKWIDGYVSGEHRHYFTTKGRLASNNTESRPKNFTINIWKRIL